MKLLVLTWSRVFQVNRCIKGCLGAGAGGAIRPSSVPAGLLRQHFDTFRGMILETFPSWFSDRQCIAACQTVLKTRHTDDRSQATRQPRNKVISPAPSLCCGLRKPGTKSKRAFREIETLNRVVGSLMLQ